MLSNTVSKAMQSSNTRAPDLRTAHEPGSQVLGSGNMTDARPIDNINTLFALPHPTRIYLPCHKAC